jgi:hypothetical protein
LWSASFHHLLTINPGSSSASTKVRSDSLASALAEILGVAAAVVAKLSSAVFASPSI